MKNRSVTLLALLAANNRLGEPPIGRTTLVKQAFLAETIRPLYGLWLRTFGFVRYYYGPYSEGIFHRLDTLIVNGLAEVVRSERWAGKVEANYQITHAGHRILSVYAQSEIVGLAHDLIWALQSLGVQRADTICKLVYQEAEFARIFAHHEEAGISAQTRVSLPLITAAGNETFTTLATLQELQRNQQGQAPEIPLPSREIVRLFLLSLARQVPRQQNARDSAA